MTAENVTCSDQLGSNKAARKVRRFASFRQLTNNFATASNLNFKFNHSSRVKSRAQLRGFGATSATGGDLTRAVASHNPSTFSFDSGLAPKRSSNVDSSALSSSQSSELAADGAQNSCEPSFAPTSTSRRRDDEAPQEQSPLLDFDSKPQASVLGIFSKVWSFVKGKTRDLILRVNN